MLVRVVRSLFEAIDSESHDGRFFGLTRDGVLIGQGGQFTQADINAGRIRYQPFFTKMYGDCRSRNALLAPNLTLRKMLAMKVT